MASANNVTPEDVAQWMAEHFESRDYLYQQVAVVQIRERFGDQFIDRNRAGNPAIDKRVLAVFRKLTGDHVIWERGQRVWRLRRQFDKAGRRQD